MSQGSITATLDDNTSGSTLVTLLETLEGAVHSSHKGPSAPSYKQAGMIWLDDTATPWYLKIYDGADWITIGPVNATGNVFGSRFAKGANVASAAALPLLGDGNAFDVTGAVTITSINSVAIGTIAFLHFTGTPLLTYHATNLILPGAANIQPAAGDEAIFFEYGAGTWRCLSYQQAAFSRIQHGVQIATTSGTSIDFTGVIPAWAKRITCMFNGVSTSGTSIPILQLGDSGGIETSGYLAGVGDIAGSTASAAAFTTGFPLDSALAASTRSGKIVLDLMNPATFTWIADGIIWNNNVSLNSYIGGVKATSAALDRVRLTTVGGTDTFDAGTMNISWE